MSVDHTGVGTPLRIGPLPVWPPVVLAPMAGITNAPFRRLCRTFEPGGLFVSEMITARGLAERNDKTLRMARFADDEPVRSIQLYGTEPRAIADAVGFLVGEERADHIDLNFGCPVAKVTRKGGGAALPVHGALFRNIVRSAVRGAGQTPVTVKLRIGVDDRVRTFLDAGRIAEDEGAAAVSLHARTAEQHYSGRADWAAIAALRAAVTSIPVLGNGDIWEAADALRMVDATGCDGVVVGRGWSGAVAWAARGCSATWRWPSPAGSRRLRHASTRCGSCCGATLGSWPNGSASRSPCATSASTWAGTCRAIRWAPAGAAD